VGEEKEENKSASRDPFALSPPSLPPSLPPLSFRLESSSLYSLFFPFLLNDGGGVSGVVVVVVVYVIKSHRDGQTRHAHKTNTGHAHTQAQAH